jgi:sodium/bile acid cotransporter 7
MNWLKSSSSQLLLGVFVSMFGAYFFPWNLGEHIDLQKIVSWGIIGIFFFYGLKLNPRTLMRDVANWRLHLFIQSTTYLIFPLIILVFYPLFKDSAYFPMWLSLLFLAALPSTVSSSVIMTSVARGNIASAIFNATLSGLLGVIITPLWVGLFLNENAAELSPLVIMWGLTKQILIPLLVGLLLSNRVRKLTNKIRPFLSAYDKLIIFLIIYKSFSAAFLDNVFSDFSWTILIALTLILTVLFIFIYWLTRFGAKLIRLPYADQLTAIFCTTQKSLVHASVFVIILIPNAGDQSIILLAVMIYHSLQLIYLSYLAGILKKDEVKPA